MEPPLQIFSQIFFHGLNATQDRAADYTLIIGEHKVANYRNDNPNY